MVRNTPKHVLVAERQRRSRRRGVLEELESLFGRPPLLAGEDELAYLDLADRVRSALEPRDMIDEMFARDVADLHWEVLRYRRAKANVLRAAGRRAAWQLIRSVNPGAAWKFEEVKDTSDELVGFVLKELGLTQDQVHANALLLCLPDIEWLDALLIKTEARRNVLLRESDRRKELAQRLKWMCAPVSIEPPKALPAAAPSP